MSNKETLQEYNTKLTNNGVSLNSVLETVNNLPEYEQSEPVPMYIYEFTKNPFSSGTFNFLAGSEGDEILAIMQDAYDKGFGLFVIEMIPTHTGAQDVGVIDVAIKIADGVMSLVDNYQNITTGNGTNIKLISVKKTLYAKIAEGVVTPNSDGYVLTISGFNTNYSLSFLETDETITGKKTFNKVPDCSVAPTANYHLVNKKYVDDAIATIEIPEGGGGEFEVVGSPIFNIEFGYFQDNSNILPSMMTRGITAFTEMYEYCLKNNIKFATIYATLQNDSNYKGFTTIEITDNPSRRYMNMYFINNETSGHKGFFYSFALTRNAETGVYSVGSANNPYRFNYTYVRANAATTITAAFTYNTLPIADIEPTEDKQLVNKKYVDDAIAEAITTALEGEY